MSGRAVIGAEAIECRAWAFGVFQSSLVTLTVLQKPCYLVDISVDLVTIFGEGIEKWEQVSIRLSGALCRDWIKSPYKAHRALGIKNRLGGWTILQGFGGLSR